MVVVVAEEEEEAIGRRWNNIGLESLLPPPLLSLSLSPSLPLPSPPLESYVVWSFSPSTPPTEIPVLDISLTLVIWLSPLVQFKAVRFSLRVFVLLTD